ncbi:NADAR domain-containing protein [Aphelenchoides fujianensis]|nr:NADAR domain-containing protein [Aphelenchoides fujianensis]
MNTRKIFFSDLWPMRTIDGVDGRKILPFYATRQCLSNFFLVEFKFEGEDFHSVEQAFAYAKAKHFKDEEAVEKILAERNPKNCKQLGRAVENFDKAAWDRVSYDVMLRVLRAKFSQHSALREFLVQTGDALIVEASANDRRWGCGMGATDPNLADPSKYPGENRLGRALMEIREDFRTAYGTFASS